MENMNEKSEKKHSHRQKSPNDFAKTVVIFVCVELIIVVGAIIGVNKNACNAVHKLEAAMPKSVMDLQINPNQDTYVSLDSKELDYGSFVADIIVEKRGIEAPVYYGLNRVYRSGTAQVFRLMKMQTLLATMPIRLSPLMTKHISNRLNMSSRAIKLRLKRLIKQ